MFPGSAYRKISEQRTPATHTVFYPCLWPLKAPGSTFGGVSPNLASAR